MPFCKWGAFRRKGAGLTQVTLGVWDKILGKHSSQKYPSTVPGFGTIMTKLLAAIVLKKWCLRDDSKKGIPGEESRRKLRSQ